MPTGTCGIVVEAFVVEFGLRLGEQFLGAAQFLEARDHREHDAHVEARGGAQDGAQLNLEQPRHFERDANRAPSEERILLARHPHVGRILVGADVEGANRHRALAERLQHPVVERDLLVLVGEILVGEERELRAQQPDALGAVLQRERDIVVERDVGIQPHAMAVAGRRRLVRILHQLALEIFVTLGQRGVVFFDVGTRVDVDDAGVSVEHQRVVLDHRFHQMLDAHHGGNFERAREDRGMRGHAARLQRDADQVLMRHQRELRERQLLGHDDGRLAERTLAAFLAQMAQHAMADVAEVGRALAQVAVGDIEHLRRQLIDDAEQRALGGESLLDGFAHAADEFLVFEDHAMAVENLQIGVRHHRRHAGLERAQFGERSRERLFEALLLGLHVAGAQRCDRWCS